MYPTRSPGGRNIRPLPHLIRNHSGQSHCPTIRLPQRGAGGWIRTTIFGLAFQRSKQILRQSLNLLRKSKCLAALERFKTGFQS